jgi:hypothetical protein
MHCAEWKNNRGAKLSYYFDLINNRSIAYGAIYCALPSPQKTYPNYKITLVSSARLRYANRA